MGELYRNHTRSWEVGEPTGLFIWDNTSIRQPRWGYSAGEKPLVVLPTLLNAPRWKSMILQLYRKWSQKTRKTIRTRKTILYILFLCSQRLNKCTFFWCRPLLCLLKNWMSKPSVFGPLEIDRKAVQWGVGMEWTDDITLLFLNYIGHKLYRIFGPKAIEWFFAEIQLRSEHSKIHQIQVPAVETFIIRDL